MGIFYSIPNIAGIKVFIICTSNNPNKKAVRRDFLLQFDFDSVADYLQIRPQSKYLPRSLLNRIAEV